MEEVLLVVEVAAAAVAVVASGEKISTRRDCTMSSELYTAPQFRNLANYYRSDESSGEDAPLSEVEEDVDMDEGSSSSDEEEEQTERPYNELLQLLQTDADSKGPARKRRKIGTDANDAKVAAVEAETAEAEPDALQDQAPSEDEDAQDEEDDDDAVGPFEKHFNLPDGSDIGKKIEQVQSNKWVTAKKEVDGLRFVQSVPDMGDAASLLPAIKSTANLKVGE